MMNTMETAMETTMATVRVTAERASSPLVEVTSDRVMMVW